MSFSEYKKTNILTKTMDKYVINNCDINTQQLGLA